MPSLPAGTVTLLFTDIEGSTKLARRLGDGYRHVLASHRSVLRAAFAEHNGIEVDTQGDSFFVAFGRAHDAVAAAAAAQRALADSDVRVRIGVHTGEPPLAEGGYYVGVDLSRAARICAAAHGGQVLLSRATRDLVGDDAEIRDLGEHLLKDIEAPERLYQLVVARSAATVSAGAGGNARQPAASADGFLRAPTRTRRDPPAARRRSTRGHADRSRRRRQDAARARGRT